MGDVVPFICPCYRCRLRIVADHFSDAMDYLTGHATEAARAFSMWNDAVKALPEATRDRLRFPGPPDETETEEVN